MGGVDILHVDDDKGLASLTADLLERKDSRFNVETATRATEGTLMDPTPPRSLTWPSRYSLIRSWRTHRPVSY